MNTTIVFRGDGNPAIGLGHIYRLISFAESIRSNFKTICLTHQSSKDYDILLKDSFDEVVYFKRNDLQIIKAYREIGINLVVIDGYNFDYAYQATIKKFGYNLICIDDSLKGRFSADAIVNHNLGVLESDYEKEIYTKTFLGFDYLLVRNVFFKSAQTIADRSKDRILISMGGTDFNNISMTILKIMAELQIKNEIFVVVGLANQRYQELIDFAKKSSLKIEIYRNLDAKEMAQLMSKCKKIICTSSTVMLEAFVMQLQVIGGYYVENQINSYDTFKNRNFICPAGDFNLVNKQIIKNALNFNFSILASPKFDHINQSRFIKIVKSYVKI